MKKKHRHHVRRKLRRNRLRNASSGVAIPAPRPRARPTSTRASSAPDWKSILAAVIGGAGSAALGGLLVNQQVLSSQAVGLGLMLGGGATAYFSGGLARIVGTSIAAAGAGQLALTSMNKRAINAHSAANTNAAPMMGAAPAPAGLRAPAAPPPIAAPRQSANTKGVVLDMFRDAAGDLDTIEDEWRYGIRDDGHRAESAGDPIVIDLDEAA